MDRLPAVVAFVLSACNSSQPSGTTVARTDAVAAAPKKEIAVADFCEQQPRTPFTWPALDEPAPPIASFTWVNIWATWCQPCLEEMGMLREWDRAFDQQGTPVDLVFLSVDSRPEDIAKYREKHPDMPATLRAKDAPKIQPWLERLGIDGDAALPIHLLVNKDGTLECVRAGMMGKQYFDLIKSLAAR
jgi:thiol-disulfide isomerase/thioredoxin